MKKSFSKVLSLILSLIFVLSAIFCVPVNAADNTPGTDIPLIYVLGQGVPLYRTDENGGLTRIYSVTIPDGFIEAAVKENIGVFAKAVFTQKWEEFGGVMHDIMGELYGPLALDENGEVTDGSINASYWKNVDINPYTVNGKYGTEQFTFMYDFRLDPYKIADDLHGYIERVMEVTGQDHVALLGRCLGACITAAYMEKYDGEYISDLIWYCGAHNGATVCSKLFAGDIYLDDDGIERFVYDMQLSADEVKDELLKSFITLFNKTYGLDLACWAVNNVWNDIYLDIMPQVLIETFGTWPGYWSMVSDEDYIRAKENVFHNADTVKYANFINIIDKYHYNVQVKIPELLNKFANRGIDIYNVSKYGYQAIPINAPSDMLSDNTCGLCNVSCGATVTSLYTVFDDDYLANARLKGTDKYISPDKQVDASTCLFPDRTWFIKNLEHKDFPEYVNNYFDRMVNVDGFNVNSDEDFPQYAVYLNGSFVKMTEDNCDTTTQKYKHTFFEALKTFVKSLIKVIIDLIKTKINVTE